MAIVKALYGHDSFETAYMVDNYPYGRLKCKMYFWLETKPKKGVRLVMQSENPKTGKLNKPHCGTYNDFEANLYLDENNHCHIMGLGVYSDAEKFLEFIKAFPQNPSIKTVASLCKVKYAYLTRCIAEGKTLYGALSEADKTINYPAEMAIWRIAYNTALGLDPETPIELKKKV